MAQDSLERGRSPNPQRVAPFLITMEDNPLLQRWRQDCSISRSQTTTDVPNYWCNDVTTLEATANINGSLELGTGQGIYEHSILPAIESAQSEVILVTCFWARSKTLDGLNGVLRKLSIKREQSGGPKIRVRLCFSSLSLFQNLFHTRSQQGQIYPPSEWKSKLGLPAPEELQGLDLQVKSIFFVPFSVLHPKFVIVDRHSVFLPSCNVSWENWLEGCVSLSGNVVDRFVTFWADVWASEGDRQLQLHGIENSPDHAPIMKSTEDVKGISNPSQAFSAIKSIFLPSPHHVNPRFSFLPWKPCPQPPPTPLNVFLSAAIDDATHSIYIQTPNLTSPPVLTALHRALQNGVDVEIITSEKLMIAEQLVTAGTTTKRCVSKLRKLHERSVADYASAPARDDALLEEGMAMKPGRLSISFFKSDESRSSGALIGVEPVQSHFKLTIIDEEWTVLGSGNMDRASWFTSQELGVAFCSERFARHVRQCVGHVMATRKSCIYESDQPG